MVSVSVFLYKALDRAGRVVDGVARSSRRCDLVKKLSDQGGVLIRAKRLLTWPWQGLSGAWLFGQLSRLLKQRIPLLEALRILENTANSVESQCTLLEIRETIQQGVALSDAVRVHTSLPAFVSDCLAHAESSGVLLETCRLLHMYFERQSILNKQKWRAIGYPMVLFFVLLIVFTLLLTSLVPQLREFLEEMPNNETVQTMSSWLLFSLSDFLVRHPLVYSICGLGCIGGVLWFLVGHQWRKKSRTDELLWMMTLSLLIQANTPLIKALKLSLRHVSSSILQKKIKQLTNLVQEGRPFHEALLASGFSRQFSKFVEIGTKSGDLGGFLQQGSEFELQQEMEKIQRQIALISPLSIGIVGSVLLWIVWTIFTPFYQLHIPV